MSTVEFEDFVSKITQVRILLDIQRRNYIMVYKMAANMIGVQIWDEEDFGGLYSTVIIIIQTKKTIRVLRKNGVYDFFLFSK